MRHTYFVALLALALPVAAFADDITLTNGDHITGSLQKLEDGKLLIKTDYAKVISVDWKSVASIHASPAMFIQNKGGTPLRAEQVTRQGDHLTLGSSTGTSEVADSDLSLRSEHEQQLYEQSLHPGWGQNWKGTGTAGLALTRGNSASSSLSLSADAARKTLHDNTALTFTSVYAKDNLLHTTTANETNGGLRYDHNLVDGIFAYGSGFFETNDLQFLSLRSVLGGGLGWHIIDSKTSTLNILFGAAYTREHFDTGLERNFSAGTIGEDYTWAPTKETLLQQDVTFDGYLNAVGDYRTAFDLAFSTHISRLFSWQTKFTERYVSNPLPGTRNNDLLLATGLGITFNTTPK